MTVEQLNSIIGVVGYFEGSKVTDIIDRPNDAVTVKWLLYSNRGDEREMTIDPEGRTIA